MPAVSLLAPGEARIATAALSDIARALERVPPPADGDLNVVTSLLAREPGFTTFYAYLDRSEPRANWRRFGVRHLEHAISRVPYMSGKPFFSYGFAGTAWAVEHLNGWFIEAPGDINDEVDDALITLVEQAPTLSYDLQYGLVGFGIYALERLPRPAGRRLLEGIIARLDRMAEPHANGLAWRAVNAAWVEGTFIDLLQKPAYWLGAYNGIAGVVGLLGGAIRRGIATRRARRLLEGALTYLWSRQRPDGLFPAIIQLSWMGGSLGIAAVVFAAARAAGLAGWESEALAVARRLARSRAGAAPLRDASLGMGAAGAAHMFHRFHLATGERCFAKAAQLWTQRLLRRRRPGDGLAGYRFYIPAGERAYIRDPSHLVGWLGLPGLINGVAGIGLCLLAVLRAQDPAWDRMLLLSHR
jgi:hypothetical protein